MHYCTGVLHTRLLEKILRRTILFSTPNNLIFMASEKMAKLRNKKTHREFFVFACPPAASALFFLMKKRANRFRLTLFMVDVRNAVTVLYLAARFLVTTKALFKNILIETWGTTFFLLRCENLVGSVFEES